MKCDYTSIFWFERRFNYAMCEWFNPTWNQLIMMTSSNGNIFHVTGPLYWEYTGHRWITRTRPVTRSFDVFFYLHLNKWLSKQSWGWWFETPLCSLWRFCNVSYLCSDLSESLSAKGPMGCIIDLSDTKTIEMQTNYVTVIDDKIWHNGVNGNRQKTTYLNE